MNQNIYQDERKNEIRLSKISKIEAEVPFTGFGIKYVVSGEEQYFLNHKKFVVREGQYIIGNDFTKSVVQINHKQPVEGICIDISPQVISEVAAYHDMNESEICEFLLSDQFLVNRYNAKNTSLGYTLQEINQMLIYGKFSNDFLRNELFYSLAESIINDQRFVLNHFKKMNFKKSITNEDVFRSLLAAKNYIDESALENLSLEQIALQANISKYHFIRLFKNVLGTSPYQYQRRRRLELGRQELMQGRSVLDTALWIGYPDIQSFSKAFKQIFGQSPGHYVKSNF
ncbi:MAG: helix-turn-helix transcriptional regulator [Flavobacteriales bacterium]|jgi:AraC family transcriptional regulator